MIKGDTEGKGLHPHFYFILEDPLLGVQPGVLSIGRFSELRNFFEVLFFCPTYRAFGG